MAFLPVCYHRVRTSDDAIRVIGRMVGRWHNTAIGATLNHMGIRTGCRHALVQITCCLNRTSAGNGKIAWLAVAEAVSIARILSDPVVTSRRPEGARRPSLVHRAGRACMRQPTDNRQLTAAKDCKCSIASALRCCDWLSSGSCSGPRTSRTPRQSCNILTKLDFESCSPGGQWPGKFNPPRYAC